MRSILALVAQLLAIVACGLAIWRVDSTRRQMEKYAQAIPRDSRDIHFVPTPTPVVDTMLELAEIGPDDLVLDLGCGDGRLVITAAKRFGCRSRGYDIDPRLIEQCKKNARQTEVADLVEFHVQDIYNIDISDAAVVLLYLSPEMNLRLLPQLQTMAGTGRVVSHDFEIPGVKPEIVLDVDDRTGPSHMHMLHRVFLYRAPFLLDSNYEPQRKSLEKELRSVLEQGVLMDREQRDTYAEIPKNPNN